MTKLPQGWDTVPLIDCSLGKPGYGANSPAIEYDPTRPRYVRITDITADGRLTTEGAVSVKLEGNEKYILRDNDFLFARSGATVGKTYLYRSNDGPAIYAGYLIKFCLDERALLAEYLKQFTQSSRYALWVKNVLRAGAQPNINATEYSSLPIPLPPLSEQRKIVQILRTWDEAIAAAEQLVAALQRRKKGLMQRLLTGHVRFPEFIVSEQTRVTRYGTIPVDWDYEPIGDIAVEISVKNRENGPLPVLSCTKYEGLVDSLEYFRRQIFSQDTSTYKVVRRGQFAYATNHIEEGSIGYQDLYDEALISPMYTVFQANERVDDAFLYRLLKTELYRHIFEVNTSGTVNRRGRLGWDDFARIKVPLPGMREQKRIAEFFGVVDQEIEAAKKQVEALKTQKKGLMQRLLTGQVRVQV